jgi:hypothetical protein
MIVTIRRRLPSPSPIADLALYRHRHLTLARMAPVRVGTAPARTTGAAGRMGRDSLRPAACIRRPLAIEEGGDGAQGLLRLFVEREMA